ncbi:ATP synthase subunit c [Oxobacter pfennigii]|uniref:ATP synthase subunit c n=1 Tax=Oxobacter pfennigii TaxID=36849 RepID=A0A0N8NT42_9CLOT|nr:ATP synthase subunit C [Oxobacter pfennigii]KPU43784.1 ATP synthase subunit c [Oxobacter pfennigii]
MYIILVLMGIVITATISTGIMMRYKEFVSKEYKCKSYILYNLFSFTPLMVAAVTFMIPRVAHAADGSMGDSGLGFIAAALSTGFATLGTGIAVGSVGSSALGAVSEDPRLLGRSLIYVGLAEGIAIYGLIVSILILGRL